MKKRQGTLSKISAATDTFKELAILYLSVILSSSILYALFEHKNVFVGVWWAVVTAMTVGYGDTYPVTVGGRVVAIILMHIVSLFIIPLITARIAMKLIVDKDTFTHTEQEDLKHTLKRMGKYLDEQEAIKK